MDKIKVLWIITNGIRRNGICVSQLDYFKKMNKDEFIIDVVAAFQNSKDMIDEYKEAGCRVVELTDRRNNLKKYLKELKSLINNEKYDIVHVHGSSTLMAFELMIAKKCRVPVRIAHSRNTTCDKLFLNKILRNAFNRSYNYALACGEDAGKWLFGNREFQVFHNGKDLKKYSFNKATRKKIREIYNLGNKQIFGHVGLFNQQKNHDFLIDVFAKYHECNKESMLMLIGAGSQMSRIKEKVENYKISDSVIFLGKISNVDEVLQGLDFMLFPSFYEGLPNVVLEWQAAGLTCLISDKITKECAVCDLVDFLPIDNGIESWIDCIESKKKLDDDYREKKSTEACKALELNGFELNNNAKKLEGLYKHLYKEMVSK